MKISSISINLTTFKKDHNNLIKGETPKVAPKQVDNVEDINHKGPNDNHRISFKYNKDLGKNIAHVVDNSTGETVKKLTTDSQVDHMLRMNKLMGLHVDVKR